MGNDAQGVHRCSLLDRIVIPEDAETGYSQAHEVRVYLGKAHDVLSCSQLYVVLDWM